MEKVWYPKPELEAVLGKTLGVPLFQEQAMKLVMVAAGFSAAEADRLRRAMAAWRYNGSIEQFHRSVVEGMIRNGYAGIFCPAMFRANQRVQRIWLSRKPCGFVCPAGLRQRMVEALSSGGVLLPPSSTASRWGFMPRPNSCAMRANMAWKYAAWMSITVNAIVRWRIWCLMATDCRLPIANCRLKENSIAIPVFQSAIGNRQSAIPSPPKRTWGYGGPAVRLGFRMVKGLQAAHGKTNRRMPATMRPEPFRSIDHFHEAVGLPISAVSKSGGGGCVCIPW